MEASRSDAPGASQMMARTGAAAQAPTLPPPRASSSSDCRCQYMQYFANVYRTKQTLVPRGGPQPLLISPCPAVLKRVV